MLVAEEEKEDTVAVDMVVMVVGERKWMWW